MYFLYGVLYGNFGVHSKQAVYNNFHILNLETYHLFFARKGKETKNGGSVFCKFSLSVLFLSLLISRSSQLFYYGFYEALKATLSVL